MLSGGADHICDAAKRSLVNEAGDPDVPRPGPKHNECEGECENSQRPISPGGSCPRQREREDRRETNVPVPS